MADNTNIYYGKGISVAGNIDIGGIGVSGDSRLMVKTLAGLDELVTNKRVYDGMIVYCEATKTYHQCSVQWNESMDIVSSSWKQIEYKSAAELESLIKGYIATETTGAMEFKGTTTTLPVEPQKGDMWKIVGETEIVIDDVAAKTGDTIIYNGTAWVLIPSGDDIEDTDTVRPVKVNNIELLNEKIDSGYLNLEAGDNVTLTPEVIKDENDTPIGAKVKIDAADTHYESKLVVNSAADDSDIDNKPVTNDDVCLHLVENDAVKSTHKIVGTGGAKITHLPQGTEIYDDVGILVETVDADTIYVDAPNKLELETLTGSAGDDENSMAGGITFNTGELNEGGIYPNLLFLGNKAIKTVVNESMEGGIEVNNIPGPDFGFWDKDGFRVDDFAEGTVKDYVDSKMDLLAEDIAADIIPIADGQGGLAGSALDINIVQKAIDVLYPGILDEQSNVASVQEYISNLLGYDPTISEIGADYTAVVKDIINQAAGYKVFNTGYVPNEGFNDGALLAPLAKIAQTGNVEDLVQTENTYIVFNCGSSSTVI